MKKLLLLSLLPFAALAQQPFQISGKAGNSKEGTNIYLSYVLDRKAVLDSSKVTNGSFSFSGQLLEPVRATLYAKPAEKGAKRDVLSFYVEPASFAVAIQDSLKLAKVSGSRINDDEAALKLATQSVHNELNKISDSINNATEDQKKDPDFIRSFRKRYAEVSEKLLPIQLAFARNHRESYLSISALTPLASNEKYLNEGEKTLLSLSAKVKETKAGKTAVGVFSAAQKTRIGLPAIAFTQNNVNGEPISLSSFKGKYVLIDFWASWCGPCRKENPNVVAAYQQFKDKGFTVLGVSLDKPDAREAWVKAIADDQLEWTQVSDLKFWDNEVAKAYGVRSIPANFLIDPTGKIVAKGLRGEALPAKLEELLSSTIKTK